MLKHANKDRHRITTGLLFDPKVERVDISVYDTKEEFDFGNCATIAMSMAFNTSYNTVKEMFKLAKINCENGLTTEQCTLMIKTLGRIKDKVVKFTSRVPKRTKVARFVTLHKKGLYLVATSEHVFYLYNGSIIDGFFYSFGSSGLFRLNVECYWEIKSKPKPPKPTVPSVSFATGWWSYA